MIVFIVIMEELLVSQFGALLQNETDLHGAAASIPAITKRRIGMVGSAHSEVLFRSIQRNFVFKISEVEEDQIVRLD